EVLTGTELAVASIGQIRSTLEDCGPIDCQRQAYPHRTLFSISASAILRLTAPASGSLTHSSFKILPLHLSHPLVDCLPVGLLAELCPEYSHNLGFLQRRHKN